ncbi:MAG: single-stranded DNA-binding protein, partial [Rhodococcus sp.]|nr:single-stranded DNA-binding protein [Rhodococcus sp. (in: high G+C Gram-positive bacteria)]
MNETYVTVVGYAGTNPILTTSGKPYVTFRLGSTRRIRRDGEWVDSP